VTITASGFVDTDNVAADQRAVRIPGRLRLLVVLAMTKHSRGVPAPEVLFTNATIAGLPEKEGGRAPKGASSQCPRRAIRCHHLNALRARSPTQRSPACGGGRGGGSPHGAPRRRLPKRPNASAQPRPRFAQRRGRRRYPRRRSRFSGAPRAPVVVPEGTMPEPPELKIVSHWRHFIVKYQNI
jgi:hypothetical protein